MSLKKRKREKENKSTNQIQRKLTVAQIGDIFTKVKVNKQSFVQTSEDGDQWFQKA